MKVEVVKCAGERGISLRLFPYEDQGRDIDYLEAFLSPSEALALGNALRDARHVQSVRFVLDDGITWDEGGEPGPEE